MIGKVSVVGDLSQWNEDKARIKADLESLAGEFGDKLEEKTKKAAETFAEAMKGILDRLEAVADKVGKVHTPEDQGGQGRPSEASGQTVTLDDQSKAILAAVKESLDNLVVVLSQR